MDYKQENKEASCANNQASDSKLLGRSFMYMKKRSCPNIKPCGTSALTLPGGTNSPTPFPTPDIKNVITFERLMVLT